MVRSSIWATCWRGFEEFDSERNVKYDLVFDPPLMNAAGGLGFTPPPRKEADISQLGAFITNPVSLGPRHPAQDNCSLAYPGGFLLHSGYPNPGLKAVIKRYGERWKRSTLPVVVHLLAQDAAEADKMAARLEPLAGVIAGLELGLPPWVEAAQAIAMIRAASGELPVIVRLPHERGPKLAAAITAAIQPAAFSLGAPRGSLAGPDGELIHGRLYGPGVFPQAVESLLRVKEAGLPVIAAGGVYSSGQIETMLNLGALAVQLDAVLWRGGN
jgi:dihydroorotate dehydrogenase (NAD+) catalytic subunit